MKILHINCNYVGTALHRIMVNHLDSPDYRVTVFTPLWNEEQRKSFIAQDNEIVRVCFSRIDRLLYFNKQRKILSTVINDVPNIEQYDIIHAFTLLTDGNVAYTLSKKYSIPYVVAIRDTDINDFFRLKPYLIPRGIKIMKNASAVFFLSEAYKQLIFDKFIPEKDKEQIEGKTYIIPNGIDDFWLDNINADKNIDSTETRIAQKEISAICVGRISKRKNIPTVQAALSILREKGWDTSFTVVGKVEDEPEFKRILEDKTTTYYPPTDKNGLIGLYRNADIFVMPSHTETFGLVYAEAMTQGLPVIYTKGQGFDGQFPDGEVGYAVRDTDPRDVAEKILLVCQDYSRIALSVADKTQKFKWDKICRQYKTIYSDVVQRHDVVR